MQFCPENSSFPFSIAYVDEAGQSFVPTSVTVELRDGDETLLETLATGQPAPGSTALEGVIPPALNTPDDDGGIGVRAIVARLTMPSGAVLERSVIYGVEPAQVLVVGQNSFQTMARALVSATGIVNLTAFNAEELSRQKAALIEAYRRITHLRLSYTAMVRERECTFLLGAEEWETMTAEGFEALPSGLKRALRHAQIVEADELLQSQQNDYARMRAAGVQSESIGETSITFQSGMPAGGRVSTLARTVLAPYLNTTIRIGRA